MYDWTQNLLLKFPPQEWNILRLLEKNKSMGST